VSTLHASRPLIARRCLRLHTGMAFSSVMSFILIDIVHVDTRKVSPRRSPAFPRRGGRTSVAFRNAGQGRRGACHAVQPSFRFGKGRVWNAHAARDDLADATDVVLMVCCAAD
jgi:hypothetical protein